MVDLTIPIGLRCIKSRQQTKNRLNEMVLNKFRRLDPELLLNDGNISHGGPLSALSESFASNIV